MIHTVKGFGIVNKAEIDVFLELSFFFHYPVDGGNLIAGSSAFSFVYLNFILLLYNTVLVLPYIDMNPPQVYMSSQP